MLPLFLEMPGELGGGGGLARALESNEHDHGRRVRRHGEAVARAAEQFDQFVAHHLDHVLAGGERGEHVLADGFGAYALDEASDDLEVDGGFEQRYAHLTERFLDVFLRQAAEATEPVEDSCQSRSEAVEHGLGLK